MFADLRDDQLLLRIGDEDAAGEGAVSDGARTEQQVFGTFRVRRSPRPCVPDPVQAESLVRDGAVIGHVYAGYEDEIKPYLGQGVDVDDV